MRLHDNVQYVTNRLLLQPASTTASDTAKSKSTGTSEGTYIMHRWIMDFSSYVGWKNTNT